MYMKNCKNFRYTGSKRNAFTIVELVIVVLIIGVLVTAVLASSSIVKKAKFQAIVAESIVYRNMVEAFEQQYSYLPGDFPNAYSIWNDSCANNASDCNGNGNGFIDYSSGTTDVEAFRAWQHMYLAGISGLDLPGIAQNSGEADFNYNVPRSSTTSLGWTFDIGTFINDSNNEGYQALRLGAFRSSSNLTQGYFSVQDAKILNNKYDNGVANTGNITYYCAENFSSVDGCYTGIIEYDSSNSNLSCFMEFKVVSNVVIPGGCGS